MRSIRVEQVLPYLDFLFFFKKKKGKRKKERNEKYIFFIEAFFFFFFFLLSAALRLKEKGKKGHKNKRTASKFSLTKCIRSLTPKENNINCRKMIFLHTLYTLTMGVCTTGVQNMCVQITQL